MYRRSDSGHRGEVEPESNDLSGLRFVLLQGPSSRFFLHLGRALQMKGAAVSRIGFCPGDRLFWTASAGVYVPYRGQPEDFGDWLLARLSEEGTTDILMLGDGRAHHAAALEAIGRSSLSTQAWIIEHGYLRPNLILIEPDGMGGNSRIPDHYKLESTAIPLAAKQHAWPNNFLRDASMDIAYHISNVLFAPLSYPHYHPHSGIHPFLEYSGWLSRIAQSPLRAMALRSALSEISDHKGPLFVYPLQLSQDLQLVRYGTGETQKETCDRIIASFLKEASEDACLVVKVHPLDNGLTNWRRRLAKAGKRIIYLDGGNLDSLLQRSSGVVTVNSTVGIAALRAGVPTLALGQAVYRTAGLTWEGPLDKFWRGADPPLVERVDAFMHLLAAKFHVPGTFDGPGAPVGARELARWLARSTEHVKGGVA